MQINLNDKAALRKYYKQLRANMNSGARKEFDTEICEKVTRLDCYCNCDTVLVYVSSPIEVGTLELINHCFEHDKKVYAPRCVNGTNDMSFYRINSFDDLETGYFGIQEPKVECEILESFEQSICIVPALSYDYDKYRLGFGKGFYDKFLSKYTGAKVGICYDCCVCDKLCSDEYDVPVDILITERRIIRED